MVAEEMLLKPGESEVIGLWIDLGSRMEKDANWQRIEWLTTGHLVELARAENGLDILYRNPSDERLWEKAHDHPGLPDGGPPRLSVIDNDAAAGKYPDAFCRQ